MSKPPIDFAKIQTYRAYDLARSKMAYPPKETEPSELEKLRAELAEHAHQFDVYSEEINKLRDELAEAEQQIDMLTQRLNARKGLDEMRQERDAAIEENIGLRHDLQAVELQRDDAKNALCTWQMDNDGLRAQLAEAKGHMEQHKTYISRLIDERDAARRLAEECLEYADSATNSHDTDCWFTKPRPVLPWRKDR